MPLVVESFDWVDGVYKAATMGSEVTAAAEGKQGVVRRDPFAMLPFVGYNMGDYFNHWLEMGEKVGKVAEANGNHLPKIFKVNWFRRDADGKFAWDGYGQNMRVLEWIIDRVEGRANAIETPIGYMPTYNDLNWSGMDFSQQQFETVTSLDKAAWQRELQSHDELFEKLGNHVPEALKQARKATGERVDNM